VRRYRRRKTMSTGYECRAGRCYNTRPMQRTWLDAAQASDGPGSSGSDAGPAPIPARPVRTQSGLLCQQTVQRNRYRVQRERGLRRLRHHRPALLRQQRLPGVGSICNAAGNCVVCGSAATSVVPSTPVRVATPSVPPATAFPAERRISSAAPTTHATPRWCVPVNLPAARLDAEARRRR